ncbi:hypothetical protein [Pseudooceanicola sp.]|uniref:hypothetical protein n=1 Tax=Pseudooceanicola sp. TaxID=1914328 RepID=UPI0035C72EFD
MTIVQKVDGRHLRKDDEVYTVIGRMPGMSAVRIELNGVQSQITLEEFHEAVHTGGRWWRTQKIWPWRWG